MIGADRLNRAAREIDAGERLLQLQRPRLAPSLASTWSQSYRRNVASLFSCTSNTTRPSPIEWTVPASISTLCPRMRRETREVVVGGARRQCAQIRLRWCPASARHRCAHPRPASRTTQASVLPVSPGGISAVWSSRGCTWTDSICCTSRNFSSSGKRWNRRAEVAQHRRRRTARSAARACAPPAVLRRRGSGGPRGRSAATLRRSGPSPGSVPLTQSARSPATPQAVLKERLEAERVERRFGCGVHANAFVAAQTATSSASELLTAAGGRRKGGRAR